MAPSGKGFVHLVSSLYIVQSVNAALVLPQLQPITGFPGTCLGAYSLPIPACPDASTFLDSQSSDSCDKSCFEALNSASRAIQNACKTSAAYGDTVISHAFNGDLSVFICGNEFNSDITSVTATNVASSVRSQTSTVAPIPASSSTTEQSETTETATTTSEDLSTTLSSSTTTVSSTTTEADTSSPTSTPPTRTTSMPKSTDHSSTQSAPRTSTTRFDTTPFDQGTPSHSEATPMATVSPVAVVVSSLFCFIFALASVL